LPIIRNEMPSKPPAPSTSTPALLARLGECIRARRKALGIAAVAAAEASGVSRTTLHRIEKGEPAVTIGAYVNVVDALGLRLELVDPGNTAVAVQAGADGNRKWIPATVRIADYPQLKRLAWQVHGAETLRPAEALDIYERNWRHVDKAALQAHERALIDALRHGVGARTERV